MSKWGYDQSKCDPGLYEAIENIENSHGLSSCGLMHMGMRTNIGQIFIHILNRLDSVPCGIHPPCLT